MGADREMYCVCNTVQMIIMINIDQFVSQLKEPRKN